MRAATEVSEDLALVRSTGRGGTAAVLTGDVAAMTIRSDEFLAATLQRWGLRHLAAAVGTMVAETLAMLPSEDAELHLRCEAHILLVAVLDAAGRTMWRADVAVTGS